MLIRSSVCIHNDRHGDKRGLEKYTHIDEFLDRVLGTMPNAH